MLRVPVNSEKVDNLIIVVVKPVQVWSTKERVRKKRCGLQLFSSRLVAVKTTNRQTLSTIKVDRFWRLHSKWITLELHELAHSIIIQLYHCNATQSVEKTNWNVKQYSERKFDFKANWCHMYIFIEKKKKTIGFFFYMVLARRGNASSRMKHKI